MSCPEKRAMPNFCKDLKHTPPPSEMNTVFCVTGIPQLQDKTQGNTPPYCVSHLHALIHLLERSRGGSMGERTFELTFQNSYPSMPLTIYKQILRMKFLRTQ